MVDAKLRPALPSGIPQSGRFGAEMPEPGVRARLLAGHSIVLVQPYAGDARAASEKIKSAFGIGLPATGRAAAAALVNIAWTGAGAWLATSPEADLAARLGSVLGESAATIDQTDGRCLFRVGGRDVRRTLEKGTTLDLHPRAFAPGHAAATVIAHIPATIRQIDELPTYEIAVSRSLAGDFWHWLHDSAAEYGLELEPPDV